MRGMMRLALLGVPGASGAGASEIDAICPAITPTLGEEILSNPGFEGEYVDLSAGQDGSLMVAPGWQLQNIPVSASADTEVVHGGDKSQKVVTIASGAIDGIASVDTGTTAWSMATAWAYKTSGTLQMRTGDLKILCNLSANATWTQLISTGHHTAAPRLQFLRPFGSTVTGYVDDASWKPIVWASMLHLIGTLGQKHGTYACRPTVAAQTQAGMAVAYADENNYLLAYVNRVDNKAYLSSMIGGVWTENVISGAISYGAERELKVVIADDGACVLYYNLVQVGSAAQVALATLGADVYGFSAHSANTVGRVQGFFLA